MPQPLDAIARLFDAIKAGDEALVQAILAENGQMAQTSDPDGQSALLTAIYYRNASIVEAIRAAGATVDLHAAAALGDLEKLRAAIGEDPAAANHYARDGFTPLQLACFFGQEAAVHYLLEEGADLHAVSRNQMSIQPIHAAVAGRNAAIVQTLIDAGADVNAQQSGGFTPLQAARQNQDGMIIAALEAAGTTA
jgi:uncharacterized protein